MLEKKRTINSNIVINPSMGDSFVGQCCLTYLLHSTESHPMGHHILLKQPIKERYQQSLIRYASKYLSKHLSRTNLDAIVLWQLKDLFAPSSNLAFQNWVKVYNYDGLHRITMKSESPLWCAALHGLAGIVEWLLPSVASQTEILDALYPASLYGHVAIVNILLESQAKFDYQAECAGTATQGQISSSSAPLIKNMNNKVVFRHRFCGYAVEAASECGHEHIVELLLANGADVNAQGGRYGNALQAASQDGHNKIVELLLEKGANVNAQGGLYGNALQAASQRGHNKIVELLLEKGANVNAQGGLYGNALQAASQRGCSKIVELLLEKGADVNAQGGEYGNALQAASQMGHRKIVELLLEKGADVNAQGGRYGNALQAASQRGHNKIVELLLANGADVNAQGGVYGDALQAASHRGHNKIVELLLEKGANVNAQGGLYGNALPVELLHQDGC